MAEESESSKVSYEIRCLTCDTLMGTGIAFVPPFCSDEHQKEYEKKTDEWLKRLAEEGHIR